MARTALKTGLWMALLALTALAALRVAPAGAQESPPPPPVVKDIWWPAWGGARVEWEPSPGAVSYHVKVFETYEPLGVSWPDELENEFLTTETWASGEIDFDRPDLNEPDPRWWRFGIRFEIQAVNAAGSSAPAEAGLAAWPPTWLWPPDITATALSSTVVRVRWNWRNIRGATGYHIQRSTGTAAWVTLGGRPHGWGEFYDRTAMPATRYSYRVLAWNPYDASLSNAVDVVTPRAPVAPGELKATLILDTRVALAWKDNSWDETAFRVARKDGNGAFREIRTLPPNTTSFLDVDLRPGYTYTYRVRAQRQHDFSAYSNEVRLVALTPPANLAATAETAGQVRLTWEDRSSYELSYRIERASGTEPYREVRILGVNASTYLDSGLTPATAYTYRVRATGAGGLSAYSNEVAATTPP